MEWDPVTRSFMLSTGTIIGGPDFGPGIPPASAHDGLQEETLILSDGMLAALVSDGYSGLAVQMVAQPLELHERAEVATYMIDRWQRWVVEAQPPRETRR